MTNTAQNQEKELDRLRDVWETLAKEDPLWAILSDPEKMGGKWDLNEFLQTGLDDIHQLFETLSSNDIEFERSSALDFGCGVGRLTQALARHFESVSGVDISPTMIENARSLNRYGDKCTYRVNVRPDLRLFEDDCFSFVYSSIVLQHIEPEVAKKYLAEFGRILKPGGLLVFQLPSQFKTERCLPGAAYSTSIQCAEQNLSWSPSSRATLAVSVRNTSPVSWPCEPDQPIVLGNHWLDEAGGMIRQDDGRATLPRVVLPGETVDLTLDVNTPSAAGRYTLELDLVQEGSAWFKSKGAQTLRLPVEILSRAAAAPMSPSDADIRTTGILGDAPPAIEESLERSGMYYIPRPEVVALLHHNGMRLEFITPAENGGPSYPGYFYFARAVKAPRGDDPSSARS